ncbi:MAG: hypothetical protein JW999_03880 [Methanotrichaceae archaeon]|nr:hypothetical protein [Methanotrichaceae archaeon]
MVMQAMCFARVMETGERIRAMIVQNDLNQWSAEIQESIDLMPSKKVPLKMQLR